MNFVSMLKFNLESALMLAILFFLVLLMIFGYAKRRRYNNQLQTIRDNIKKGDKVMTDTGVVGEIVDISTEGEHSYFTIKSGTAKQFGFIKVHSNAVYYVFDKETPKYAPKAQDVDDVDDEDDDADEE